MTFHKTITLFIQVCNVNCVKDHMSISIKAKRILKFNYSSITKSFDIQLFTISTWVSFSFLIVEKDKVPHFFQFEK